MPKKSKSSSKALPSVWDVFPLLVNTEGLELPSLPKLSTLTPSLLERAVNVGEPGGLRSIKDKAPFVSEDWDWTWDKFKVERDVLERSCLAAFHAKKLVRSSVGRVCWKKKKKYINGDEIKGTHP